MLLSLKSRIDQRLVDLLTEGCRSREEWFAVSCTLFDGFADAVASVDTRPRSLSKFDADAACKLVPHVSVVAQICALTDQRVSVSDAAVEALSDADPSDMLAALLSGKVPVEPAREVLAFARLPFADVVQVLEQLPFSATNIVDVLSDRNVPFEPVSAALWAQRASAECARVEGDRTAVAQKLCRELIAHLNRVEVSPETVAAFCAGFFPCQGMFWHANVYPAGELLRPWAAVFKRQIFVVLFKHVTDIEFIDEHLARLTAKAPEDGLNPGFVWQAQWMFAGSDDLVDAFIACSTDAGMTLVANGVAVPELSRVRGWAALEAQMSAGWFSAFAGRPEPRRELPAYDDIVAGVLHLNPVPVKEWWRSLLKGPLARRLLADGLSAEQLQVFGAAVDANATFVEATHLADVLV
jgi:hypothetical protein